MRFQPVKFDILRTVEKYQISSLAFGPQLARNRKIEFSISFGNLSIQLSIWLLGSLGFERFKFISSTNIANSNFAFSAIPERPKDARFPLNYGVAETPQNLYEIKSFDFLRPRKYLHHRFHSDLIAFFEIRNLHEIEFRPPAANSLAFSTKNANSAPYTCSAA